MAADPLAEWLQRQRGCRLLRRIPVSGGCIHGAWKLELESGPPLFAKGGDAAAWPLLQMEADGLEALACAASGSGQIVPAVQGLEHIGDQALLLLEWLELSSGGSSPGWQQLGAALAGLHRTSLSRPCAAADRLDGAYGWQRDNVIGRTPQINGWLSDWASFFVERRLQPQLQGLARKGMALRQADRLLDGVRQRLESHRPEAVLVHGDLWSGNAALTASGGALFDPAVHRADREVDLAMARLFGGFPAAFFSGYQQAWPLPADHASRIELYNLYHLLNHANLFGGGYFSQAQAVADALL